MRASRPARFGTRKAMAPALQRPMRRSSSLASLCSRIAVDAPCASSEQPAVAGGIGRLEAERGDAGAGVERRHQPAQRGRLDAAGCRRRARSHRPYAAPAPAAPRAARRRCRPASAARTPAMSGAIVARLGAHRLHAGRHHQRRAASAPAARAVASACASIERPAMACSTLGTLERMRTPLPAARTTISRGW